MLQIFALAMGLDEPDLDETFKYPLNDITMQYYPIQDSSEQSSLGAHADYGGKLFHFYYFTRYEA
jgi:isopenicillin N synthase-like dioxygenase